MAVAREIALRQLSVRDRTRHELEQALAKKNVPPQAAEQVLDRLTEVGLINDSAFAQAWFDNQQRRQRSTRALRQELRTKGVDPELVSQASAGVADDADLLVAQALVAKRLPSLRRLPHEVRYRRLAGQLARRGFSSGVVSAVLRELPRDDTDGAGDHHPLGDEALGTDPLNGLGEQYPLGDEPLATDPVSHTLPPSHDE